MSVAIAGWIPVSETLLADALPLYALSHKTLLWSMYVRTFGESMLSATAIIERGTATWDDPISDWDEEDDDWWGG